MNFFKYEANHRQTIGILKERIGHILHEILGMKKLLARWVLGLLISEQKRNRKTFFFVIDSTKNSTDFTETDYFICKASKTIFARFKFMGGQHYLVKVNLQMFLWESFGYLILNTSTNLNDQPLNQKPNRKY